ncbi:rhodanese-like domain-containing protein [Rhodoferax sp.]|uniref:rhodanese-like domain-containing protein n=1 Tax=Rhodoferax sp. TaxID=50421 RepID=UPI0026130F47|nr:rhodanese-like domain-containing protein [Rhodoferax sp.]MDD2808661.1 rhodanese-like domain-containing protein [Rhodoferax sp.]
MKFILDNWMLILVALSAGGMLLWPMLNGAGPGALTADGAVQLMNREKAVVIDICEPAEYAQAHVVGAKNIPMGQLADKLPGAVKNKALPVILVCRSGARSSRALGIVKKLGYENVQSLSGGLGAWRSANLPIEKA